MSASIRDLGDNRFAQRVSIESFEADARTAELISAEVTLSDTPGTVTAIALPEWVRGVRLYPRSNAVRFAIDEDPDAVGTSSATSIAANALTVGGIAKADAWEVRVIADGDDRELRMRSTAASVVVDVELF